MYFKTSPGESSVMLNMLQCSRYKKCEKKISKVWQIKPNLRLVVKLVYDNAPWLVVYEKATEIVKSPICVLLWTS